MGRAPRAQFAIRGLPRIDVHKGRRRGVYSDRKFEGKKACLFLAFLAIFSVRQHGPVDAERVKPLYLLLLGRQPDEIRPLDDVIERQQPPHEHLGGRVLGSASVPTVLDAERPEDRFVRDMDGRAPPGKMGRASSTATPRSSRVRTNRVAPTRDAS